jgi:hypothetical protein
MPHRRDPGRIKHEMFEMVMARAAAIACGYEDAIDLDRLRDDPLMKVAVGRCPESSAPLTSQSTVCRMRRARGGAARRGFSVSGRPPGSAGGGSRSLTFKEVHRRGLHA